MAAGSSLDPTFRDGVDHALECFLFEDAIFLAERMHAQEQSEASLLKLATTYYQAGQPARAYALLNGQTHPDCRYLFARCCLDLNKLQEGELALTGGLFPGNHSILDLSHKRGAAYLLLGQICRRSNRTEEAAQHYSRCMASNPMLWTAFQGLCDAGAPAPNPQTVYEVKAKPSQTAAASVAATPAPLAQPKFHMDTPATPGDAPTTTMQAPPLSQLRLSKPGPALADGSTPRTPGVGMFSLAGGSAAVPTVSSLGTPSPSAFITPSPAVAGVPAGRPAAPATAPRAREKAPRKQPLPSKLSFVETPSAPSSPVRRSNRLFSSSSKSTARQPPRKQAGGKKKIRLAASASTVESKLKVSETAEHVPATVIVNDDGDAMEVMQCLALGYQALSAYRCKEAIAHFQQLPSDHFNTGWVLCQVGRAYFELADYKTADQMFRLARRHEAHRVAGMEIYSTVLWHLRNDTALSYLANEVLAAGKQSPEAWCVVGNCFSLQKEHDAAVKFFQRAIQIDSSFTYAYTLLGHEYVYTEDFVKAMACFRCAIRNDPRHYNAWYGLGMIYYRQEKHDLAEYHFQRAVSINPGSSVLLCYLGLVQHAQLKSAVALTTLQRAGNLDPRNPLVRFNKAMILFATDRNEEALKELAELQRLAPRESSVYFLTGKVYKKMGQHDQALIHFSWAMDLDPKGSTNLIKDAIDQHQVEDEGLSGDEEEDDEHEGEA
eukprot:m.339681 g.339681  ORF g.339681 m.339681 type:complete len:718 (-) comp19820_c0_seq7:2428-4581(-)